MQYIYDYKSPLGKIILTSDENSLTGLYFDKQKYFTDSVYKTMEYKKTSILYETINWLDIYFSGKEPNFMPKISLQGTSFRMEVWQILQKIPYGKIMTYKDIAEKIANKKGLKKMSAQAVGGAVGHNPISIIIPCHRVVGSNGSLVGYAGGIEKKVKLLTIEKVNINKLFIPQKGTAL